MTLRLDGVRSMVVFAAHPDDAEIGAGGLLLALAATSPGLRVRSVVFSGSPSRRSEAQVAAAAFLPGADVTLDQHELADGRLPASWADVKAIVQQCAAGEPPDLVLAPRPDDAHQDHRLLGELASQAFRGPLLLHYEIPKWDGDLRPPNVYVRLAEEDARRKVELLHRCFSSQAQRQWWDEEVFCGLMRLRGMESRSRYAEGFVSHKLLVDLDAGIAG